MTKTYHFIGIKGSGMSALALMLHQMGHKVQGSDVDKYYFTQEEAWNRQELQSSPSMRKISQRMWN